MPRRKITSKEFVEQATGVRLSAHEKLCAERMKHIQESIKELSDMPSHLWRLASTANDG